MTAENFGQDLGRLFEVGFNIGILTYIEQHQLKHRFGNLYCQDLSQVSFPKILRRLVDKEQVISEQHRHIVEKWSIFFLQKGFLTGINFFSEYLKSIGWNQRQLKRLEILYYQCSFSDDNSMGTYPKGREKAFQDVLSQFEVKVNFGKYAGKGDFLNADTLMFIQCDKERRVLCVDLSIFSIKSVRDLLDIDSVEIIKSILLNEIKYLKSKSIFANLGLDSKGIGFSFSEDLARYFTAFKREDKESVKLIQAASYTYSFYEFMRSHALIDDADSILFNVVGCSDRGICTMTLRQDSLHILATCSQIYKQESSDLQIKAARREVLQLIQRNAAKNFERGRDFIKQLVNIPVNKITPVVHSERIEGFFNSGDIIPPELAAQLQVTPGLDLRNSHAELIKKELASERLYIFLTGNPGIGKTTAISDFLKEQHCLNEGFLLFYVSPRTQVNLDIIDKFMSDKSTNTLCDNRLLTVTTNDVLIKSNGGRCTVNYLSNLRRDNFIEKIVSFINGREKTQHINYLKSLKRTTEDRIKDVGLKQKGVLYSICEAIHTIIAGDISNNIVAAVALQSLKVAQDGKDTLEHFERIFKTAYNQRDGAVLSAEMQKISSRIKHIFIMVDEITGDEGGVEFLNRISSILHRYEITDSRHGFNPKIIVADASIVERSAIEQHLQEKSPEPNKIFFRKTTSDRAPLSIEYFNFRDRPASIINSNSYPAKRLTITYKVLIESVKYNQTTALKQNNYLRQSLQFEIVQDINFLLENPGSGQIIVYIQDKQRLSELIQLLRESRETFQLYEDYLEIHANLSEQKKKEINQYKNNVKIIFMTASASRGLSFPKTKHILVDVPRFEIEKNLMEIIQVIYRGRGNYYENGVVKTLDNEKKELIFYLSERSVTYGNDRSSYLASELEEHGLAVQESALSILNILLILKASIMTRIFGYGQIGQEKFIIIPIGGKSIIAAGQTFSTKMNALIKQLKKEYNCQPYNQKLKEVYISLEQLLSRADMVLRSTEKSTELSNISYLAMQKSFSQEFTKLINNNFGELLSFKAIEAGYISGSLLVIPVPGILEENYEMRLEQEILKYADLDLLERLKAIRYDSSAPESLRSTLNEAIELIKLLREKTERTQNLEQNSQRCDRYYAIPLFAFLSSEALRHYFSSTEGESEDRRFRDILDIYVRSSYPVGDILPIGHKYSEFPFVVFTSYSLAEIRNKIFTDKYLLNSHELNLLSLILSRHTDN